MVKLTDPAVRHIQALYWATTFAFKTDLVTIEQRQRAKSELYYFIDCGITQSKGERHGFTVSMTENVFCERISDEGILIIQSRARNAFVNLLERSELVMSISGKHLKEVEFLCLADAPARRFFNEVYILGSIEDQVVVSIGVHLAGSGLTANRILMCPECGSVFIRGERKPEEGKPQYCSRKCAQAVANRMAAERRGTLFIKGDVRLKSRESDSSSQKPAKGKSSTRKKKKK